MNSEDVLLRENNSSYALELGDNPKKEMGTRGIPRIRGHLKERDGYSGKELGLGDNSKKEIDTRGKNSD